MMADPKKPVNPVLSLAGIVGGVGGWALSRYAGASLWIPGAATVLLLLIFAKTPVRPKFFTGAIAVTGGHITWFVIGSAVAHMWAVTGLDILALSVGVIWLWTNPGLAAAIFLGILQLALLAVNAVKLNAMEFGGFAHRALTVHCVWRILALICLVVGYRTMQRSQAVPPPLDGLS